MKIKTPSLKYERNYLGLVVGWGGGDSDSKASQEVGNFGCAIFWDGFEFRMIGETDETRW